MPPAARPPPRSPRTPRRVSCGWGSWLFQRLFVTLFQGVLRELNKECFFTAANPDPSPSQCREWLWPTKYRVARPEHPRSQDRRLENALLDKPTRRPERGDVQQWQPGQQGRDPWPDRFPIVAHAGILPAVARPGEGEPAQE